MKRINGMNHFWTTGIHHDLTLVMSRNVGENGAKASGADNGYLHTKSLRTATEMIRGIRVWRRATKRCSHLTWIHETIAH